jgi:hypothetical protein
MGYSFGIERIEEAISRKETKLVRNRCRKKVSLSAPLSRLQWDDDAMMKRSEDCDWKYVVSSSLKVHLEFIGA